MPTLLLLLSIPILSGLALLVDHYARNTATQDEFGFLAVIMRILGLALAGAGLAAIAKIVLDRPAAPPGASHIGEWMTLSLFLSYAAAAVVAGIMAEWCGRAVSPNDVVKSARADRNAALFRLLCWTILLSPLSLFMWWFFIAIPMIATTILSCLNTLARGHETSLLWRLALAAENGVPFEEEVEAAAMTAHGRRRAALFGLADRLRSGRSLADSLEVGKRLLPRSAILAIRAAENSRVLPEILRAAARQSVRDLVTTNGASGMLPFQAYIANVFVILICIINFLMYWIVPKLKEIFSDFAVELPPVTRALIRMADGVSDYWYFLFPAITLPAVLVMIPSLVSLIGWSNLNFPLLMRWFPRRDGPMILRALAAGIQSSRPAPEVFTDLAEHCQREDLRGRLQRIAERVGSGGPLWESLTREGFIRKVDAQALEAAAQAGHLNLVMNSLADALDHRQRVREAWWMEWQRPAMIAPLALIVGFVCIGIFQPLVKLLESLT
jgi:type II secretory pathway component PulF